MMERLTNSIQGFLKGMSHTLDLGSTLSTRYEPMTIEESQKYDAECIKSDWIAIGSDLESVLKRHK
jgi:hypothetical protein